MHNPFSLEGKTILVTGASSGIGRAIAIECSKMGATIIITARNKARLAETFSNLSGIGDQQIIADLTDENQISYLVDNLPKLDGCIFCAGIGKTLVLQSSEKSDITEVFESNTFAHILLTQLLVQKKHLNKNASLVYISSVSGGKIGYIGGGLYGASKGAIEGFIKGTALELAGRGIRLNSVSPAMIETPILDNSEISEEQLIEDKKRYPLKRYGKPEEVAYAVIYLLSDASVWVTGSNLLIDGGYTLN
ncbi:MAG: SDR family oxidoreductase [Prevotella sp.]|jgi:NAD(P)-dependent dehydrogenase (short-subunit alcohol dehydrogenase family)|nr:SDR family oxidoreductase [Prevotella sp.]